MSILLWTGVIALFLIGLAGTLIPAMPGISLVFGGVLLYGFATDFASISVPTVIAFGVLTAASLAFDYVASVIGARAGGGTWKAAVGAGVGAILGGILFTVPGILGGAFLGGFLGALLEGVERAGALRVAAYSVVGVLGASIVQFVLGVVIIAGFVAALIF